MSEKKEQKEPKLYAVRVGKKPGIYETWAQCQAQVKGVQGAQFRAFPVQERFAALDFIQGNQSTTAKAQTAPAQKISKKWPQTGKKRARAKSKLCISLQDSDEEAEEDQDLEEEEMLLESNYKPSSEPNVVPRAPARKVVASSQPTSYKPLTLLSLFPADNHCPQEPCVCDYCSHQKKQQSLGHIRVFLDGSCKPSNPGFTGCACYVQVDEDLWRPHVSKNMRLGKWTYAVPLGQGTNASAEIHAVHVAVVQVRQWMEECAVQGSIDWSRLQHLVFYYDSTYATEVVLGIKEAYKHQDLIQVIKAQIKTLKDVLVRNRVNWTCVTFEWVKAHSGNPGNEIVDKLAQQAADISQMNVE